MGACSLREYTNSDWIDVHKYASQEKVCRYQPWGPNREEDSKAFVMKAINDAIAVPRIRYVLAVMKDEKMVGTGEFNIRDFTNKVGEVSYIVNPEYWGIGIATDVAILLIDFGFRKLKLHRIYATCDPRNAGSSKVLEKAGMTKEGRIRQNLFIKGEWRDSFLYSILEQEWEK